MNAALIIAGGVVLYLLLLPSMLYTPNSMEEYEAHIKEREEAVEEVKAALFAPFAAVAIFCLNIITELKGATRGENDGKE